jgi:hypothetical protein
MRNWAKLSIPLLIFMAACREPKAPKPKEAAAPEAAPAPAAIAIADIAPNTEEEAKPANFSTLAEEYGRISAALTNDSLKSMLQNQARILAEPANPQIKREVMERQFNGAEVFAAGVGKPNPRMNAAQNRIGANRAAVADAVRWLAYFKYWQDNNFRKSYGSLKDMPAPAYQVVQSVQHTDGSCAVMAKISLQP